MQEFEFVVRNPEGLSVIPAGKLIEQIKKYDCATTIGKNGQNVKTAKLYHLIDLDVKEGETITVMTDGAQEIEAAEGLRAVAQKYL